MAKSWETFPWMVPLHCMALLVQCMHWITEDCGLLDSLMMAWDQVRYVPLPEVI